MENNMKKRWCSCSGRLLRDEDSGSSGCTGGGGSGGGGDGGVFEQQQEEGRLPGFRFHPTDEELVGFYLKRKVDKRPPLSIDIIKQVDIYKHDPWDLAKVSSSVGDKEWYFYCKRGRKYRNSIRPNRVTGSGFWKATGIDRPIYSNNGGEPHKCIGLKKSLVYYRGTAGKGSKTDWMMHEFRLPTDLHNLSNPKDIAQEAEIWTLCRIFKRHKRHTPDWRELSAKKNTLNYTSSKTSSIDSDNNQEHYISFASQPRTTTNNNDHSDMTTIMSDQNMVLENHNIDVISDQHQQQWSSMTYTPPSYSSSMNLQADDENDLQSFPYYNTWDDLSSVVDFAVRTQFM